MGNCIKKKNYQESTASMLLNEYSEYSPIQIDSNTNNIDRLNEKYKALEYNFNQLDNSVTKKFDNLTENDIKTLSEDIHHLNQEFVKIKQDFVNLQNSNKLLIKKLSNN